MGFITRLQNKEQRKQETCADQGYNCCDCGDRDYGCGCRYCWTCSACDECYNDNDRACTMLQ